MMRHKMRVVAILTFSLINGETAPSTPTNGGKCQQLPPTIIVDKIAEGYVRTAPEKTTPARSTPGTNIPRSKLGGPGGRWRGPSLVLIKF
jgi:hypothetical protein